MRPTRRGVAVVATLAFSWLMAWQYGSRSLSAIVFPLVIALLAAAVTVARTEAPTVTRTPVEPGFVGETRTVETAIEPNAPLSATVSDRVGASGLAVDGTENTAETTISASDRFRYDVRLEARGEHAVGPISVVVTDLLGLTKRRFEDDQTTSVLVFPKIYDLTGGSNPELQAIAAAADREHRGEFDHLREYVRGDSLRDVHWKSAAKRPDDELIVKEFDDDGDRGAISIAAECPPGYEDEMATAVASVGTYLLEQGVPVGVVLPEATRAPANGRAHQRAMLRALAVVEAGELDDRTKADADVLIRSDTTGTTVLVDGREIPFDRLRGRSSRSESPGGETRPAETDGEPPEVRS
ncbi:DUF58 domain-containing protein [Halostagnicola kamekurae]|uniref:Uncharacterized conserved protein, DUF58 family, contains vWF domain n=1 Tax=Halostagnicola kamekurae TaxID=619731 RepID=A0A1I6RGZ8_9EURY|nr:DUF58 domain-containing protein [Halostagnicola kamekurae]SFS63972.1 Uncharacterized conserved protein, DUF58 family, contains vWF domain [Halostagnicola kamekurae]